jgi:hypothetical protein
MNEENTITPDSNLAPQEPAMSKPSQPAKRPITKLVIEVAVLFTLISIGVFALVYMKNNMLPPVEVVEDPAQATQVDTEPVIPDGAPLDQDALLMDDGSLIDAELENIDSMDLTGIEEDYSDDVLDDLAD